MILQRWRGITGYQPVLGTTGGLRTVAVLDLLSGRSAMMWAEHVVVHYHLKVKTQESIQIVRIQVKRSPVKCRSSSTVCPRPVSPYTVFQVCRQGCVYSVQYCEVESQAVEALDLPAPTCFRSRSHSYLRAIQAGCSQDEDTASVTSDSPPPTTTAIGYSYSSNTSEYQ